MEPSIYWVDSAPSTNSLLASEADMLPHGAVISARMQTAGRGQRGNTWESEPEANLTFSMLLRPEAIDAVAQFELSMVVALGICDALQEASGTEFKVKWPNDIYASDKKVCGILIENSLQGRRIGHSIAGVGINVNQRKFVSDAPNPVSLVNLTGRTFDLDELLAAVCRSVLTRLERYERTRDAEALLVEYRRRLWRGSGFFPWRDAASGEVFEAEIAAVATTGILTLRDKEKRQHDYAFKEVAAVL